MGDREQREKEDVRIVPTNTALLPLTGRYAKSTIHVVQSVASGWRRSDDPSRLSQH